MRTNWIRWGGLFLLLVFLFVGCKAKEETVKESLTEEVETETDSSTFLGGNIGILFPDKNNSQLAGEAEEISQLLQDNGYEVEIAYAEDSGSLQAEQMKEMIKEKKNCLIIDPVDSSQLEKYLKKASKQGITVISYDQIISGTDKISYYVGFNHKEAGEALGKALEKKLKLSAAQKEKRSYTIEFFMGALEDMNAQIRYQGIMKSLEDYFDTEVLQSKSLRISYEDVSIAKASAEIAGQTCNNIMKANYMDSPVDVVCVGDDEMAQSVIASLKEQSGFTEDWPLVTGSGGTKSALEEIEAGELFATISYDRSQLPKLCADLANKEIQGDKMKDLETYHNGSGEIPAIFGEFKLVDE